MGDELLNVLKLNTSLLQDSMDKYHIQKNYNIKFQFYNCYEGFSMHILAHIFHFFNPTKKENPFDNLI